MRRPHHSRRRRNRSRVPTAGDVATGAVAQGASASGEDISRFLAQLQPPRDLSVDSPTKYLAFEFAAASTQTWRVPRGGYVTGLKTSAAQCYVGIGSIPSSGSMNGSVTKVWDLDKGLIYGDGLASVAAKMNMRHRFEAGDIILALGPIGSLIHMWVTLDDVAIL